MRRLAFALVALLAACSPREEAPAVAQPTLDEQDAEAQERARAAALDLGATLKGRLQEAMKAGGPVAAVEACASNAGPVTVEIGRKHRAKLGRSSLRLRNPDNAGPPWVRDWLRTQGERPAEGAVGIADVVRSDGARAARLLKPLTVEPACLVCHGPSPAPEVASVLAARYPEDRAVGYSAGDLRGALWVEVEIQ
jgi:hypothetical protein